jgi:S1-C subfamily serine protease
VAALVGGAVAAGVTTAILRSQSRVNPQNVPLGSNVTITEEQAAVQVAAKAQPAVVSIVTQDANLTHGSGFLVTSDGYIVTNVAVVANAQSLTVLVAGDSKRHDARLIDFDCPTGLAVLKMDQVSSLPTLAFDSTSSPRAGQTVIVVPGALDAHGVAPGSIGAVHAMVSVTPTWGASTEAQFTNVIETNARVDSSVSGAPLLNVGGQVIGLTLAASSQGQPVQLAIPASDLQPEVEQVVQGGELIVPSLGAQTAGVSAELAAVRGGSPGARITSLDSGGPAERAGLKTGDMITQLDDQRLDDAHPLGQVLRARFKPDQRVTVSYTRSGAAGQVQLQLLGEHPSCGSS